MIETGRHLRDTRLASTLLFSDHSSVGRGKTDRQYGVFCPDVFGIVPNPGGNTDGIAFLHLLGSITHGVENPSLEHVQNFIAVWMIVPRIRLPRFDHGLTNRHGVGVLE